MSRGPEYVEWDTQADLRAADLRLEATPTHAYGGGRRGKSGSGRGRGRGRDGRSRRSDRRGGGRGRRPRWMDNPEDVRYKERLGRGSEHRLERDDYARDGRGITPHGYGFDGFDGFDDKYARGGRHGKAPRDRRDGRRGGRREPRRNGNRYRDRERRPNEGSDVRGRFARPPPQSDDEYLENVTRRANAGHDGFSHEAQSYRSQPFESYQPYSHPPSHSYSYSHSQSRSETPSADRVPGLATRSKTMLQQVVDEEYQCMVCMAEVGVKDRVWGCGECHTLFHVTCVGNWAMISEEKAAREEDRDPLPASRISSLKCPACNLVNEDFRVGEYRCYCRKVRDPRQDRFLGIPHSCGEVCGRERGKGCPHPCTAVCHPGPCEPCRLPGRSTVRCPCGKLEYRPKCGQRESKGRRRLCGKPCEKVLTCGNHHCEKDCHEEDCGLCEHTANATCFCGKTDKVLKCGEGTQVAADTPGDEDRKGSHSESGSESESESRSVDVEEEKKVRWSFSCGEPCDKVLACGAHRCRLKCHAGSCSGCPRPVGAVTMCACGKTEKGSRRKRCTDPLPTCGKKCDRMLSCGKHMCKRKCHDSECAPCKVPVKKPCRCKSSTRTVECSRYEQRSKQSLLAHQRAGDILFDVDDWIRCKRKCNRILTCGRHRCKEVCCKGTGKPIGAFDGHRCRVPCGKPLSCGNHNCERSCHTGKCAPCGVTYRDGLSCACGAEHIPGPVRCGAEKLRQCVRKCNKMREDCDHYCVNLCHHGACPPCAERISVPCATHGTLVHNVFCHIKGVCCGDTCGQMLPCGKHRCTRKCHNGTCAPIGALKKMENGCEARCGELMDCGHRCAAKCHPRSECVSVQCKHPVVVRCACGVREERQVCKGRMPHERGTLACGDVCAVEARNKRFREAFNILPASERKVDVDIERRIPFASSVLERCIVQMGGNPKKQTNEPIVPKFVEGLEEMMEAFIKDNSPNFGRFRKCYPKARLDGGNGLSWPNMARDERFIVYSVAAQYHLKAESIKDFQYNTAYMRVEKTEHCRMPVMRLSEAITEYQKNRKRIKTLESCPPECMIVIDDATEVKGSTIHDRLLAWSGDYQMWRCKLQVFLVFTTEALRNSALTEMKRFGGRKAVRYDAVTAVDTMHKKERRTKAKQSQQQKIDQENARKQKQQAKKSNAAGWKSTEPSSENLRDTSYKRDLEVEETMQLYRY